MTLSTSVGRSYRQPDDEAAILGASQTAGQDVIPASARGRAIPPVERLATSLGPAMGSRYSGQKGWVVRLRCSLWRG
ncbi:hypothetical protein [Tabrizicola sp.]|uniref:hypothetical protein n=1 Tax=Tabrizicola sp. TaxID=2005166 RepID=UPI00286A2C2B|nr:hypothetical protein [Tabrizicola sp.]